MLSARSWLGCGFAALQKRSYLLGLLCVISASVRVQVGFTRCEPRPEMVPSHKYETALGELAKTGINLITDTSYWRQTYLLAYYWCKGWASYYRESAV